MDQEKMFNFLQQQNFDFLIPTALSKQNYRKLQLEPSALRQNMVHFFYDYWKPDGYNWKVL